MRRIFAVIGSTLFFLLAPFTVAGLIPFWISHWHVEIKSFAWLPAEIVGSLLVAIGSVVLLDSFARFALKGLGTPAPVFPTRHLVVSGLYRFVRNPMYVAVLAVILGQALIFTSPRVLEYGAAVWLAFHLFVCLYEEPTLRRTFGAEYEAFCAGVPRWIPRAKPWKATSPITE
ncbi:MAG TPA: isoprenylcysteine carboxylmethyltransferase family protein [Terriglobales bacterium]|nr:isoprenylcysteine carboxylmethyltransferase family protein [Terriglobales bacterium]